ncbi:MAG: YCF48-related protein, partial [Armatimonadota bacterium]
MTTIFKATRVATLAAAVVVMAAGAGIDTSAAQPAAAGKTASWTPAGWGGGGLYWAAVFHPTNPDVIYMGGDVAGVYKTEDAGKHWRLINNGLTNYAVYSLAIAPSDPQTVYAGTTNGLCKTTDGGASWALLPGTQRAKLGITAERNKSVRAIAVDPTDSRIVYAGTPKGKIFRSGDGGQTWKEQYTLPTAGSIAAVAIAARRPSTVFAATSVGGIVRSTDGGAAWQSLETPKDAYGVTVAPSDPNIVYAAFDKEGLQKSVDGGKSWAPVGVGIDPKARIIEVVVAPKDPLQVSAIASAGWSGRFYASRDGGKTWAASRVMRRDPSANPTLPEEAKDIEISKPTNLAISPTNPSRLFIAANWRTCLSDDGGKTWEERDRGADISVVYDVRFSGARTYASAMDEGVLASDDGGKSWNQLWPRKYDATISGHFWRLGISNRNGVDRIVSTSSPWDKPGDLTVTSDDGGKTIA